MSERVSEREPADTRGAADQLIWAARAVRNAMDGMGAGVATFGVGDDADPDRWAVAVVVGRENVEALGAWQDELDVGA